MVKRPGRKYLDHHQESIKQNVRSRPQNSKDSSAFKYMFFYTVIIFLIGLLVILYINQYVNISRKNFEIERLEEKREELKTEKAYLQLKISRLKSLDRIERIAKKELGMVEPKEINYIVLKDTKVSNEENKMTNKDKGDLRDKVVEEEIAIKARILSWFNNLSEVQAGTLDD